MRCQTAIPLGSLVRDFDELNNGTVAVAVGTRLVRREGALDVGFGSLDVAIRRSRPDFVLCSALGLLVLLVLLAFLAFYLVGVQGAIVLADVLSKSLGYSAWLKVDGQGRIYLQLRHWTPLCSKPPSSPQRY